MTTLLIDHLRAAAEAFPDKLAYRVVDAGDMTFGQWEAESNRLARTLADAGVAKGDRVALYLRAEEGLRFMVAYAAVHKSGAVAVPTNTRLTEPELERLLGHAEVRCLLTDPELADAAAPRGGGARHRRARRGGAPAPGSGAEPPVVVGRPRRPTTTRRSRWR